METQTIHFEQPYDVLLFFYLKLILGIGWKYAIQDSGTDCILRLLN
jgi:hypothetical protein